MIEHLDDDRAAVSALGALVEPGGFLVVSVPALPEMYGEFDRVQGHRRRYLPETLRAAFEGSGLAIERLFWWGAWLVPTLRRQRRRAALGVANHWRSPIDATYVFLRGRCPGCYVRRSRGSTGAPFAKN